MLQLIIIGNIATHSRDGLGVRALRQLSDLLVRFLLKSHLSDTATTRSITSAPSWVVYFFLETVRVNRKVSLTMNACSHLFFEELVLHARHGVLVLAISLKHRFLDL